MPKPDWFQNGKGKMVELSHDASTYKVDTLFHAQADEIHGFWPSIPYM